ESSLRELGDGTLGHLSKPFVGFAHDEANRDLDALERGPQARHDSGSEHAKGVSKPIGAMAPSHAALVLEPLGVERALRREQRQALPLLQKRAQPVDFEQMHPAAFPALTLAARLEILEARVNPDERGVLDEHRMTHAQRERDA